MQDELFGPYRLQQLIGRGGMGEVHRAVDTRKDRTVALKRLPADLAGDDVFQARFRREARIAATLSDPHVIPIHDYGRIDDRLFLDMRLVEGVDLATLLAREGPLAPARAIRIVEQIASALDAAHAGELVHRDVKPSNILVSGAEDFVYLIDFGVARPVGGSNLTTTGGAAVGTVAYMAPERFAGDRSDDHRGDVYALGCVLYEMLTGQHPFAGLDTAQLVYAHLSAPPPRPSARGGAALAPFDPVVARALAKDPGERFRSAGELAAAAARAGADTGHAGARPAPVPVRRSPRAADLLAVALVVVYAAGFGLDVTVGRVREQTSLALLPVVLGAVLGLVLGIARYRTTGRTDRAAATLTGAAAALGAMFPLVNKIDPVLIGTVLPLVVVLVGVLRTAFVYRRTADQDRRYRAQRTATLLAGAGVLLVVTFRAAAALLTRLVNPGDAEARLVSTVIVVFLAVALGIVAVLLTLRLRLPARRPLGATLAVVLTLLTYDTIWNIVYDSVRYTNDVVDPTEKQHLLDRADVELGYTIAFWVYAVLLVVTVVLVWARRRRRRPDRPPRPRRAATTLG